MSQYDEPTQQVRRAVPPPAPLPGSLDPLRGHRGEPEPRETGTGWVEEHQADAEHAPETEPAAAPSPDAGATGVLPLDEIFATPAAAEPVAQTTAAAEAPTWTAMPVVPVRSEPLTAAGPAGAWRQPVDEAAPQHGWHPPAGAGEALAGAREGFETWLRRDDNGLMLLTAVVACLLMIVVASVGG